MQCCYECSKIHSFSTLLSPYQSTFIRYYRQYIVINSLIAPSDPLWSLDNTVIFLLADLCEIPDALCDFLTQFSSVDDDIGGIDSIAVFYTVLNCRYYE